MNMTRVYQITRTVIFALAASGIVTANYAFASDYRHQATALCTAAVNTKGLKGDARKAEYSKCKADPLNYK
jgi:hypothetical protein